MFIDSAKILVRAGAGGKGCASFYRDKYTRFAIANGGDGGRGGDIIIRADSKIETLQDFYYRRHFFAEHGGHGLSNNKKGKGASPLIIRVPCGTIVKDLRSGCILRDLAADKEEFIVAAGGKGGLGSKHKKETEAAQPGEEKELLLDLSLIADVALVGFPNCGKSTLISAISGARPKIAGYPFTTKFPILGVVRDNHGEALTVADIPGLIEGSAEGRGLGDKFLRHIERTKLLLHLVDMSGCEGREPFADYEIINNELKKYGDKLKRKDRLIVANKMDLPAAGENLKVFKKKAKKKVYPISALKKEGLEELLEAVRKKL